VSEAGILPFPMLGSEERSLPGRPNLRRSRGRTSLRYSSKAAFPGDSFAHPKSQALVPSSFTAQ